MRPFLPSGHTRTGVCRISNGPADEEYGPRLGAKKARLVLYIIRIEVLSKKTFNKPTSDSLKLELSVYVS